MSSLSIEDKGDLIVLSSSVYSLPPSQDVSIVQDAITETLEELEKKGLLQIRKREFDSEDEEVTSEISPEPTEELGNPSEDDLIEKKIDILSKEYRDIENLERLSAIKYEEYVKEKQLEKDVIRDQIYELRAKKKSRSDWYKDSTISIIFLLLPVMVALFIFPSIHQ